MADATVTFLLQQLKEATVGYVKLIAGADSELKKLESELDRLKDHLKEMAGNKEKNATLKSLKKETRDAIFEAEDTIDMCHMTNAIGVGAKTKTMTCTNGYSFGLRNPSLAREVKSIREKKVVSLLAELKELKLVHNDSHGVQESSTDSKRDTHTPIRQTKVVGFEDQEATIIGYLKEKTKKLDVISIVGVPGQGKTTLAWNIYQTKEICENFPVRIWANVSQVFNTKDVFLQILEEFFPGKNMSSLNFNKLTQHVRECLENEKFLLVLDDVWEVDAWNKIKEVLPLDNGEAKVLVTTRERDVGERSSHRDPHKLKPVKANESWELLQYEVFGNKACPSDLRDVGYHIATKCDGVPLTIVVIGGILSDLLMNPSTAKREWETVCTNVSEALQFDKKQHIPKVVELSYQRLPDDLRQCFIFLSVFPEDYEIPAKMLCGLWIAEGFVLPRSGRSLEESAEENMNELICKNLLKVEKTNHMGKVKTCRVHDMIRTFCVMISKDEDLCQEVKVAKEDALELPVSKVQDSHRLCLHSNFSKILGQIPCCQHVRSFLCFYERSVEVNPDYIDAIPNSFKKLRILESKCIIFKQFPKNITKLVYLRYLTLHIETLDILPEEIAHLWNLQSLVVETESRLITMRANMWRMVRLRYLKTRAAIVLDSKWKGEGGQNLHTLNRLAPESCTEVVAKKAKNLKTLGISGNVAIIFENKVVANFQHLQKLKLVNNVNSEDELSLSENTCFPPQLKRLTLSNTFLDWKHMSMLAKIESLEALKLKDKAFVGRSWNLGDYKFPKLQLLLVSNTDLVLWTASTSSFPELEVLVVKGCEKLDEIPVSLGKKLEKLEIDRVQLCVVQCAKNIAKEKVPFNLVIGSIIPSSNT